mmetsp:Transcript_70112/g.164493  ORF Transcript_70112/g.164493 Transcript_70112/m.164493 type:complete len:251 (+) Transcript_70112:78-830(+)
MDLHVEGPHLVPLFRVFDQPLQDVPLRTFNIDLQVDRKLWPPPHLGLQSGESLAVHSNVLASQAKSVRKIFLAVADLTQLWFAHVVLLTLCVVERSSGHRGGSVQWDVTVVEMHGQSEFLCHQFSPNVALLDAERQANLTPAMASVEGFVAPCLVTKQVIAATVCLRNRVRGRDCSKRAAAQLGLPFREACVRPERRRRKARYAGPRALWSAIVVIGAWLLLRNRDERVAQRLHWSLLLKRLLRVTHEKT